MYVNLYGRASCGPGEFLANENVLDRVPLSIRLFGVADRSFLVQARGDSMEPTISDKDLVLVEPQTRVETNTLALVICGEEPRIKKVILAGDQVVPASLNSTYPPEVYSEPGRNLATKSVLPKERDQTRPHPDEGRGCRQCPVQDKYPLLRLHRGRATVADAHLPSVPPLHYPVA